MKQVGGECPLQGIMPTGKGTPGQEARVFLAFNVLLPLNKGKKCIYALRESSKAWQVIWVFPDVCVQRLFKATGTLSLSLTIILVLDVPIISNISLIRSKRSRTIRHGQRMLLVIGSLRYARIEGGNTLLTLSRPVSNPTG